MQSRSRTAGRVPLPVGAAAARLAHRGLAPLPQPSSRGGVPRQHLEGLRGGGRGRAAAGGDHLPAARVAPRGLGGAAGSAPRPRRQRRRPRRPGLPAEPLQHGARPAARPAAGRGSPRPGGGPGRQDRADRRTHGQPRAHRRGGVGEGPLPPAAAQPGALRRDHRRDLPGRRRRRGPQGAGALRPGAPRRALHLGGPLPRRRPGQLPLLGAEEDPRHGAQAEAAGHLGGAGPQARGRPRVLHLHPGAGGERGRRRRTPRALRRGPGGGGPRPAGAVHGAGPAGVGRAGLPPGGGALRPPGPRRDAGGVLRGAAAQAGEHGGAG